MDLTAQLAADWERLVQELPDRSRQLDLAPLRLAVRPAEPEASVETAARAAPTAEPVERLRRGRY